MSQLTFVTVCMSRLAFLKQTLPHMTAQPECEVIVVDYSCPEKTGDWVEANEPRARVLRVPGQKTISVTRARNLGAALVGTPWICFIDSDIVLDPRFAQTVLPQVKPGNFYRPHPESLGIVGTFIVAREDFQKTGGYDEVFRSYGDDDYDIYDHLRFLRIKQASYPAQLVRHLPHSHEKRAENFELKEHLKGVLINRCYRIAKWHLARSRGAALEKTDCQALYDELFTAAPGALVAGEGGYPLEAMVSFIASELEKRGKVLAAAEQEAIRKGILKP